MDRRNLFVLSLLLLLLLKGRPGPRCAESGSALDNTAGGKEMGGRPRLSRSAGGLSTALVLGKQRDHTLRASGP